METSTLVGRVNVSTSGPSAEYEQIRIFLHGKSGALRCLSAVTMVFSRGVAAGLRMSAVYAK